MLETKLLEQARAEAEALLELERQMEHTKADYHHLIRRLHLAGGSFREIGAALGMSHQRVGQIVAAGSRSWLQRWRDSKVSASRLSCSFCKRTDRAVGKLVAGPGVHICDGCVGGIREALGSGEPVRRPTRLHVAPDADRLRCAFCSKTSTAERLLAGTREVRICEPCLELAEGLVAQG